MHYVKKSRKLHILGNKVESSKNTWCYMQNRFLLCFKDCKLHDYLLLGRPLLGSFLLEQIVIKQITQSNDGYRAYFRKKWQGQIP